MAIYNPKSLKAEEFINDEEIQETLAYAEANKANLALIDEILEKARPKPTATGCACAGLTHREASVLLACEDPDKIKKMAPTNNQYFHFAFFSLKGTPHSVQNSASNPFEAPQDEHFFVA